MDNITENQCCSFLSFSPDAVIAVDSQGTIVHSNALANQMFDYPTLKGLQVEALIPDHLRESHKLFRSEYFMQPCKRSMGVGAFSALRRNGQEFGVEVALSPITLDGVHCTTIAMIRDLTEKRKLESNFNGLLEAAPDGIILVNSKCCIVVVNNQVEKLFGYTRDLLKGKPVEFLIPERYLPNHVSLRNKYIQAPSVRPMGVGMDLWGKRKDGSEFPIDLSLSPICVDSETHVIAIVRDISVRKQFEKQIIAAKEIAVSAAKTKADFLANMSHEIRTPMNGVIGLVDVLSTSNLNTEQKEYVESLKKCGESLMVIINDILDFSKIEAGKMVLNESVGNFPAFLTGLQTTYRFMMTKKEQVQFKCDFQLKDIPLPMFVKVDFEKLRQIINNLIDNAIKFTESGFICFRVQVESMKKWEETQPPSSTVETEPPSENAMVYRVKFTVEDTGIGIQLDLKEHMFTLFSHNEESPSKKYSGSGLGLVLTKRLVELMGGEMGYESEVGKGSQFWFTIDLVTSKQIASSNEISMNTPLPALSGDVLVVEDNQINLQIISKMLTMLGFKVTAAYNGELALKTIGHTSFSIILMDIQMPVMDGFETTRRIRQQGIQCPIIALTANAYPEDVKKCLEAGMNDHIAKPVTSSMIREVIQRWIPVPQQP